MDFERRTAVSSHYPVRGAATFAEKQATELRRQESLRQQIASKEEQLAKMRSTTQQLRMKLVGREGESIGERELEDRVSHDNARRRSSPLRGNLVGQSEVLAAGRVGTAEGPRSYSGVRSPEPGYAKVERDRPDHARNEFARASNDGSPLNIQQFLTAAKSTGKFKGEGGNPYGQQAPLRSRSRSRSNSKSLSKERVGAGMKGEQQRLKPYNYQNDIPEKPD